MTKISERTILSIALLSLLGAYLFFFQLGGMALTDPDETFYAQTAKEMTARAEWITPYLYGRPQFEKPIFVYWLIEASFKIFGVNEFGARFPAAVFALVGIIAIYFLGSLLFNRRVGLFSAIILATNVEYVILARACVTDMVLSTLMLLGVLFFFYGYLKGKNRFYLLSAGAFALATLTKGPIAIMLAGLAILIWLFISKDLRALKKIPFIWCALIFAVIAAPWYFLIYKIHGASFINTFFGFHNVTRFLESEHKIGSQFYYNIPIVLGGFFPWSVFLPFGFWYFFKKSIHTKYAIRNTQYAIRNERNNASFVLTWFLVIFVFFSISSTKLPTYIFPSFISLALIVAVLWDDFLKKDASRATVKGMRFSYYLLPAIVILGAIGVLIYIKIDYPVVLKDVVISTIFLILGIVLSTIAFAKKKITGAFLLIAYSVVIFLYPLSKTVLPDIERYETSKAISQELKSLMRPDEQLGCESNYLGGLAFYTGKFPVDLDKHHVLVNFLHSNKRVWCVLKEKNHRELYELDTKPYYMGVSYMVYKIGKRAIITNKMPDDGKYILKRERNKNAI